MRNASIKNGETKHHMTMKEIGKALLKYAKFAFMFCLTRRGIPSQDNLPPAGTDLGGGAKVVSSIDIRDPSVDGFGNGIAKEGTREPSVAVVSAHVDYMAPGSDGQF